MRSTAVHVHHPSHTNMGIHRRPPLWHCRLLRRHLPGSLFPSAPTPSLQHRIVRSPGKRVRPLCGDCCFGLLKNNTIGTWPQDINSVPHELEQVLWTKVDFRVSDALNCGCNVLLMTQLPQSSCKVTFWVLLQAAAQRGGRSPSMTTGTDPAPSFLREAPPSSLALAHSSPPPPAGPSLAESPSYFGLSTES
jgi:hypothetical protein